MSSVQKNMMVFKTSWSSRGSGDGMYIGGKRDSGIAEELISIENILT